MKICGGFLGGKRIKCNRRSKSKDYFGDTSIAHDHLVFSFNGQDIVQRTL